MPLVLTVADQCFQLITTIDQLTRHIYSKNNCTVLATCFTKEKNELLQLLQRNLELIFSICLLIHYYCLLLSYRLNYEISK